MEKVLVTGGAGLIGLEVCRQLNEMGHEVHLFDLGEQIHRVENAISDGIHVFYGSIVDLSSLRDALRGCDVVIHLAALLGVQRSERDKLKCIEINIEGTKNVLDCAVQHDIQKIVFASSSEVYGEPLENPITEEFVSQGKTVYAVTKLAGEELCKAYSQKYAIDNVILRYFNCYGPYQTAQFVISKFVMNVLNGKPPVIYGDGNQVRSYTYVEDTARATIQAAFNDSVNSEVLNIGNGENPITLTDLANIIIAVGDKTGKLEAVYKKDFQGTDRTKTREIFERFCDSTKAMKALDWRPTVYLKEGIKRVIEKNVIFDRWANLYDEFT